MSILAALYLFLACFKVSFQDEVFWQPRVKSPLGNYSKGPNTKYVDRILSFLRTSKLIFTKLLD